MKFKTPKPFKQTCIQPFESFPARTIGQQVRDARDFGVYPEFIQGEIANDSDPSEKGIIDPMCDPTMDRLDLLNQLRNKQNPNSVKVAPSETTSNVQSSNSVDTSAAAAAATTSNVE